MGKKYLSVKYAILRSYVWHFPGYFHVSCSFSFPVSGKSAIYALSIPITVTLYRGIILGSRKGHAIVSKETPPTF